MAGPPYVRLGFADRQRVRVVALLLLVAPSRTTHAVTTAITSWAEKKIEETAEDEGSLSA